MKQMKHLIYYLEKNKIPYTIGDYAGCPSVVIKGKKLRGSYQYKLEVFYDKGLVSELTRLPMEWQRMGFTCISSILNDIIDYLHYEVNIWNM